MVEQFVEQKQQNQITKQQNFLSKQELKETKTTSLIDQRSRTFNSFEHLSGDVANLLSNPPPPPPSTNNNTNSVAAVYNTESIAQRNKQALQSTHFLNPPTQATFSQAPPPPPPSSSSHSSSSSSAVEHFMLSSQNGIANTDCKHFSLALPNVSNQSIKLPDSVPESIVKLPSNQCNPASAVSVSLSSSSKSKSGTLTFGTPEINDFLPSFTVTKNEKNNNNNNNIGDTLHKDCFDNFQTLPVGSEFFENVGVSQKCDFPEGESNFQSYRSQQENFDIKLEKEKAAVSCCENADSGFVAGTVQESVHNFTVHSLDRFRNSHASREKRLPITDVSCRSGTVENGSGTLEFHSLNNIHNSQQNLSSTRSNTPLRPTPVRRPPPIVGWPTPNSNPNGFYQLSRTLSHFDLSSPGPFLEKQIVPIDVDDGHFLLQPVQSCNDLVSLSAAYPYEIQFSPSRVRQATQRYFNNSVFTNSSTTQPHHNLSQLSPSNFRTVSNNFIPNVQQNYYQAQQASPAAVQQSHHNLQHQHHLSAQNLNRSQSSAMNFNPFRVGSSSTNNNKNIISTTESMNDLRLRKNSSKNRNSMSLQSSSIYCGESSNKNVSFFPFLLLLSFLFLPLPPSFSFLLYSKKKKKKRECSIHYSLIFRISFDGIFF